MVFYIRKNNGIFFIRYLYVTSFLRDLKHFLYMFLNILHGIYMWFSIYLEVFFSFLV